MPKDLELAAGLVTKRLSSGMSREEAMGLVVEALWEALGARDSGRVSWVGFYLPRGDGRELVLGPHRDKPACSPIGLHGVCGRAWKTSQPQIVRDVRALGADYVACDPADLSELVYPLRDERGGGWAVLDLDSHGMGTFSPDDIKGVEQVLTAAELI